MIEFIEMNKYIYIEFEIYLRLIFKITHGLWNLVIELIEITIYFGFEIYLISPILKITQFMKMPDLIYWIKNIFDKSNIYNQLILFFPKEISPVKVFFLIISPSYLDDVPVIWPIVTPSWACFFLLEHQYIWIMFPLFSFFLC